MAEKSGDVDRARFLSWLVRAAYLVVVFAWVGCASTGGFMRLKPADLVGTYSAPLMVTWAHAFVLGEDGRARYNVTYDTWKEGKNGELIYGESSAGSWTLTHAGLVVVTLTGADGQPARIVLHPERHGKRFGLQQIEPDVGGDSFTWFFERDASVPATDAPAR